MMEKLRTLLIVAGLFGAAIGFVWMLDSYGNSEIEDYQYRKVNVWLDQAPEILGQVVHDMEDGQITLSEYNELHRLKDQAGNLQAVRAGGKEELMKRLQ